MAGKPSYAAVAAKSPGPDSAAINPSHPGESSTSSAGQGDAPPPYTAPSHAPQPLPHQTVLPPPPQAQHHHSYQHANTHHGQASWQAGHNTESSPHGGSSWVPPPSIAVGTARAQRRFWGAFFWAWVVWIVIGLVIGGGISDVENTPSGRHGHWDKHGDWHDDRWAVVRGSTALLRPNSEGRDGVTEVSSR